MGDTAKASEFEDYDLVIPFPTEFVDDAHTREYAANGILGGLHATPCNAGTAISSGKDFFAVKDGNTYGAQTGVFDLSTYRGEVEGQETAYTLVIRGMSELKPYNAADVDGDGKVNTTDVVSVYSYIIDGDASGITKEAADVGGDGKVTTADVVAIYTVIVGEEGAASPIFRAQMQQLLNSQK